MGLGQQPLPPQHPRTPSDALSLRVSCSDWLCVVIPQHNLHTIKKQGLRSGKRQRTRCHRTTSQRSSRTLGKTTSSSDIRCHMCSIGLGTSPAIRSTLTSYSLSALGTTVHKEAMAHPSQARRGTEAGGGRLIWLFARGLSQNGRRLREWGFETCLTTLLQRWHPRSK